MRPTDWLAGWLVGLTQPVTHTTTALQCNNNKTAISDEEEKGIIVAECCESVQFKSSPSYITRVTGGEADSVYFHNSKCNLYIGDIFMPHTHTRTFRCSCCTNKTTVKRITTRDGCNIFQRNTYGGDFNASTSIRMQFRLLLATTTTIITLA